MMNGKFEIAPKSFQCLSLVMNLFSFPMRPHDPVAFYSSLDDACAAAHVTHSIVCRTAVSVHTHSFAKYTATVSWKKTI